MPVETKENHKKPQSGYLVFKAIFEPETFLIHVFIFNFTLLIIAFTI
jgi:hypothetical protein